MAATRKPWTAQGEEKRAYVKRMFADISPTYDLLNSAISLRLHHRWRAEAVSMLVLAPGSRALDVCAGTGDFAYPLRRAVGEGGLVAGVDFCRQMLERAKAKSVPMALASGDACRLPFRSCSVDAVTLGWGLRNVPDVRLALAESFRVLKPGGGFVSLDTAVPTGKLAKALSSVMFRAFVPLLGALFRKREAYTYLPESTARFLAREELAQLMKETGFEKVKWQDAFFGNICIHFGKKPLSAAVCVERNP